MLSGDVARYRTQDLLREAQAQRVGRELVERRRTLRVASARRLVATAVALLPIPLRH